VRQATGSGISHAGEVIAGVGMACPHQEASNWEKFLGHFHPGLAVPIRLLASAVAYSRVHTGVHYPGDVVLGSIVGAGTSAMVAAACDRAYRSPRH
jgi:hypothetical protein